MANIGKQHTVLEKTLRCIERFIPKKLYRAGQPIYHYLLVLAAALLYRFPGKKITVIGITGTKGKSSTAELVSAVLEEAGHTTALSNTIRFKIGAQSWPNHFKMTMPGRFFMHKFLRRAVREDCDYAILEITSESTKLFRHKFLFLDALIFTNLAAEHIEAHGSYEAYVKAKLKLAKALETSPKKNKAIISNIDDKHGKEFLAARVPYKYTYSLLGARPYHMDENGISLTFENTTIDSSLLGVFNIYNILAALAYAQHIGITVATMKKAIGAFDHIQGRVEKIDEGQNFTVVVDYAHTKESLQQLYEIFNKKRRICVLGNTGGGRDTWKRPEMGVVADKHCDHIVLTDEDPYDEDPRSIVDEMAEAIKKHAPEIIMDRRKAIRHALSLAEKDDVVLITGKGTDPYIMGSRHSKTPWSDIDVVREELQKIKKGA